MASRWSNAKREDLEALAEYYDAQLLRYGGFVPPALEALRASCLRTEAEVAAEALAILRASVARGASYDCLAHDEGVHNFCEESRKTPRHRKGAYL